MGTSLSGLTPADTYQSLIKVGDNSALSATLKVISDGAGNDTPLYLSTGAIQFGSSTGLYWDNANKRLGLGTNAPTTPIDITGSGTQILQINATGSLGFPFIVQKTGASSGRYNGIQLQNSSGNPLWQIGQRGSNNTSFGIFVGGSLDEAQSFYSNGNVAINSTTDLGARLGIKGSGSTSATTSLLVQNSAGLTSLQVTDDRNTFAAGVLNVGTIYTGVEGTNLYTAIFNNGGSGGEIRLSMGGTTYLKAYQPKNASSGVTSGTINTITTPIDYGWSSGSASPNLLSLNPSINNTGTYAGTFRGIYYNPTLTSLTGTTHVAIETVTGDVLLGTTSGKVLTGYLGVMGSPINQSMGIHLSGSQVFQVGNPIVTDQFMVIDSVAGSKRGIKFGNQGSTRQGLFLNNNDLQIAECNATNYNPWLTVDYASSGNVTIGAGATTSIGAKLGVKGSGSTSATTSLLVQNSSGVDMLRMQDNGSLTLGTFASGLGKIIINCDPAYGFKTIMENNFGSPILRQVSTDTLYVGGQSILALIGNNYLTLSAPIMYGNSIGASSSSSSFYFYGSINSYGASSSSPARNFRIGGDLTLQSGGYVNAFELSPTFNFDTSGGRIVKGFYYNPTLTNIQTLDKHYGIQTTSGGAYINTATPQASAALQADSTTQGFLTPRMTNAQRLAIASPAIGLEVYCTDAVEGKYIYKSTGWTFVV